MDFIQLLTPHSFLKKYTNILCLTFKVASKVTYSLLPTTVQYMTYIIKQSLKLSLKDHTSFCCDWTFELFVLSLGSVWFVWCLVVLLCLWWVKKKKKANNFHSGLMDCAHLQVASIIYLFCPVHYIFIKRFSPIICHDVSLNQESMV